MLQILTCLLALFFSLSSPAMERNADFRQSSLAAEGTVADDHIVLGLKNFGLEDTATQVGGRTLLSDANWQTTLQTSLGNPSTRFTISLDGVSGASPYSQFMNAAQQGLGRGAVQDN